MAAVGLAPGGPVIAEDIRDFESRTLHECARLLRWVRLRPQWCEQVEQARNLVGYFRRDVWMARAGEER